MVQLLNGFTQLDEPIVVVIDDFHTVQSVEIASTLDELLRAAPASLRLVLSTRHDPMLPLHLLRASGELTELRARDLAFTPDEARELLDGLGLDVDSQSFATLLVRTEGWPAGLRLFVLSYGDRGDSGVLESLAFDGRPASEYLLAEVLRRQPEDVRDFLLATSIAERFTPDLADAMTGRTDSAQIAERLVADNLFIDRIDTQPPWYRYHNLFAELLRADSGTPSATGSRSCTPPPPAGISSRARRWKRCSTRWPPAISTCSRCASPTAGSS